jgi:pyruvate formate lyase activating enzyme
MQLHAMTLNNNPYDPKGFIFDIQGLSVHDGPGCRTLIFLNGCTLNCFWCSNPEGISRRPSLLYFSSKCIACGNCINNCQYSAIKIEKEKLIISRQLCTVCEDQSCVDECYTDALKLSGYEITVSKLFEIIRRDRQFWGRDGGITLTGGEPLLQLDFVHELLARCHHAYIHIAVETCGNIPWKNFKDVIEYIDWIFFDLKHLNSQEHLKATNAGNSLILENAKLLSKEYNGRLIFRLPLIPGFNDSKENIDSIISFIQETGRTEINILPLHHLGREKYQLLNNIYHGSDFPVPANEKLREIKKTFKANDIDCFIGSETPF